MTLADHVIHLILGGFLILGIYQVYFWCQRTSLTRPRELRLTVDDWIPYWPAWVWIYSLLYYPAILCTELTLASPDQFGRLVMSYVLLLGLQVTLFLACPVETPAARRDQNLGRTWSERLLAFVQRFDARGNSFPSMHTSVAMLTALHLYPELGGWTLVFPVLIALSCLFTKQHYVVDVLAGALVGWAAFALFRVVV
jgi:membrane-associated phospholipid phosphatase